MSPLKSEELVDGIVEKYIDQNKPAHGSIQNI